MKQAIAIVITSILIIGCENDDQIKSGLVQIDNIQMNDTVIVNENVPIIINASASNGCWSDLYIDFKEDDVFNYSIQAYGTYTCIDNGCACPAVMVYMDTTINFQPTLKGTYVFKVTKNLNNIDKDTLIVK